MTDEPLTPGSVPPEEQPRVKAFDPAVLDRAVIALPLLKEMEKDLAQMAWVRKDYPDKITRFNTIFQYNPAFPGGIDAAHARTLQLLQQASSRALDAYQRRIGDPAVPPGQTQERLDVLRRSIDKGFQLQVERLPNLPYAFAWLHAAVIRRLVSANEALAGEKPLVAVSPSRFEVIIDLNLEYPGGRAAAREWVIANITNVIQELGIDDPGQEVHFEKDQPASQYVFARLEARVIQRLVERDLEVAESTARQRARTAAAAADALRWRAIFRVWPDFEISACINKSVSTVKADAALQSFSASGEGITWAVMDSGIDASHRHFTTHANIDPQSTFHKDFTVDGSGPFHDENGHGTHVAGIIAGEWPVTPETAEQDRPTAVSRYLKKDTEDVEIQQTRLSRAAGMAPKCKLVSLRVLDENGKGSVSNLIAALNHIQEINGYGRRLLIHGVNMSVGYTFEPEWFACGQSPLCVEVDRLVRTGVVVVVAAGNTGYGTLKSSAGVTAAGMALTINDPGNADLAITVGSTHRDMPHVYGVSYFSSKGPTGDGRVKPDLVAPGEKIISCATGRLKADGARGEPCDYVETSGTSMAAPHVSGVIASFLSVRREFIGQAERLKQIFLASATDLRRDRYFQGAGLVDLMRAIQSV
jgi:serine protease AprX